MAAETDSLIAQQGRPESPAVRQRVAEQSLRKIRWLGKHPSKLQAQTAPANCLSGPCRAGDAQTETRSQTKISVSPIAGWAQARPRHTDHPFRRAARGPGQRFDCRPERPRRAFSLAISITQRDVAPSAEPDADRKPCAV